MPGGPRIQLVSDEKFWEMYLPLSAGMKDPPQELRKEIFDELEGLDAVLRPALEKRWGETDAYYEVADDWKVCRHHSMSVCSDEMCCAEFLNIVQGALAQMKHDWCFHASLECNADMGWGLQRAGWGGIFFYRGEIYGNAKDAFDYALFER